MKAIINQNSPIIFFYIKSNIIVSNAIDSPAMKFSCRGSMRKFLFISIGFTFCFGNNCNLPGFLSVPAYTNTRCSNRIFHSNVYMICNSYLQGFSLLIDYLTSKLMLLNFLLRMLMALRMFVLNSTAQGEA